MTGRILFLGTSYLSLFVLVPLFTAFRFWYFPLVEVADVIEFLSPLVILGSYGWLWSGLRNLGGKRPWLDTVPFTVLVALFANGNGIHLASNSIEHLLSVGTSNPMEKKG